MIDDFNNQILVYLHRLEEIKEEPQKKKEEELNISFVLEIVFDDLEMN